MQVAVSVHEHRAARFQHPAFTACQTNAMPSHMRRKLSSCGSHLLQSPVMNADPANLAATRPMDVSSTHWRLTMIESLLPINRRDVPSQKQTYAPSASEQPTISNSGTTANFQLFTKTLSGIVGKKQPMIHITCITNSRIMNHEMNIAIYERRTRIFV